MQHNLELSLHCKKIHWYNDITKISIKNTNPIATIISDLTTSKYEMYNDLTDKNNEFELDFIHDGILFSFLIENKFEGSKINVIILSGSRIFHLGISPLNLLL